jgi:hypothetical protein
MKKILIISGLLINQFQALAQPLMIYANCDFNKEKYRKLQILENFKFTSGCVDHIQNKEYQFSINSILWCAPRFWNGFDTLYFYKINILDGEKEVYKFFKYDEKEKQFLTMCGNDTIVFHHPNQEELCLFKLKDNNLTKLYTYYFNANIHPFKHNEKNPGVNISHINSYTENATNETYMFDTPGKVLICNSVVSSNDEIRLKTSTSYIFVLSFVANDITVYKRTPERRYYTVSDNDEDVYILDTSLERRKIGEEQLNGFYQKNQSKLQDIPCSTHFGILKMKRWTKCPNKNSGVTYHCECGYIYGW